MLKQHEVSYITGRKDEKRIGLEYKFMKEKSTEKSKNEPVFNVNQKLKLKRNTNILSFRDTEYVFKPDKERNVNGYNTELEIYWTINERKKYEVKTVKFKDHSWD